MDDELAEQPAGLAVQLHDYQRQSVAFMVRAETARGPADGADGEPGGRNLLWYPLPLPGGGRMWYMPLLRRVALDVPNGPCGGFLADEMGLGKTVVTLGLILSNPAPEAPVVARTAGAPAPDLEDTEGPYAAMGLPAPPPAPSPSTPIVPVASLRPSRGTLVVCAVSIVGQWVAEVKNKLTAPLKVGVGGGE